MTDGDARFIATSMRYLSGSLIPNERRVPVLHDEDSPVESGINWPLPGISEEAPSIPVSRSRPSPVNYSAAIYNPRFGVYGR